MEEFKIEIFENEIELKFPAYKELSAKECEKIKTAVEKKMKIQPMEGLLLVKYLLEASEPVNHINANDENFSFESLLDMLGLAKTKNIYIDWYRLDDTDKMSLEDFDKYHDYIWYAGPDDIFIFDENITWFVIIDHSGYINYLRME